MQKLITQTVPTPLAKHKLTIKRLKFGTHRVLTINLREAECLNFAFNRSVTPKLFVLKLCLLFISYVKKISSAMCITRKAIYFMCPKSHSQISIYSIS